LGDTQIDEGLKKFLTKDKTIERGVAFPTCISVNEILGHFSPIVGEGDVVLKEGDVVKIDLGAHIDGYIAMAATTVVVQSEAKAVEGRTADLIQAVHTAADCAHRLIKPGKKNTDVTNIIKKVAEQYKVTPVEGVLSHQLKRYIVDANKVIINKETLDQKVDEFEFEEYDVYCVDILFSTGDGKSKETEARTTVFKRAVDQTYLLKTKSARQVLNEINQRFPTFPFTLRALDEKRGRLGVSEMLKHDLLHPYPVLTEKAGEIVAQVKFTVLITKNSTERITTSPLTVLESKIIVEDKSITEVLAMGTKRNPNTKAVNKKKKKKAKEKAKKKEEEQKGEHKDEKKEVKEEVKKDDAKPMDTK